MHNKRNKFEHIGNPQSTCQLSPTNTRYGEGDKEGITDVGWVD